MECHVCGNDKGRAPGDPKQTCKPCANAASVKWRKAYPDRSNAAARRWERAHPENAKVIRDRYEGKHLVDRREAKRRRRNYTYSRNWDLNGNKGITEEAYRDLLADQRGRCAICQEPPSKKRLSIDHDHITNKVRGLLCISCNTAIGSFKDSQELLMKAIQYLEVVNC